MNMVDFIIDISSSTARLFVEQAVSNDYNSDETKIIIKSNVWLYGWKECIHIHSQHNSNSNRIHSI